MKKRGISTVVASVLIILMVIVMVSILWFALLPFLRESLSYSDFDGNLWVITKEGYTGYSSTSGEPGYGRFYLQIEQVRGEELVELKTIVYTDTGDTLHMIIPSVDNGENRGIPGPNRKKTYSFMWPVGFGEPEYVSLAPIFLEGGSVIEGSATSKTKVPLFETTLTGDPGIVFLQECVSDLDCPDGSCVNNYCCIYGDVDFDHSITLNDANLISQFTVGDVLTPEQLIRADVNVQDGVDIVDALFIGQYTSGLLNDFTACQNSRN